MIPLPVILNGTKCSEESRSGKNMEMTKYKLGDLCRDVVDCPHSTPEWKSEGVHVIRNFNIKNGTLDFTDGFYVDEETYQKRTQRAVPEESDLVISREAPMGAACIIPKLLKCCLGQRLVLLKINRNMAEPKYVLYAIQSDFVQQQIRRIDQTGSIVSNLNIPDLKSLLVPVPPLSEQKKIAAVLSALDDKIALNKKMNQKLEAMAKRLYDYWFVQFDFPDENGRPYKTSGGPMVYNPTLKREIPVGWEVSNICPLMEILPGGTPSKAKPEYWNGEIPFFGPTDYCGDVFQLSTEEHITENGLNNCASALYPPKTIFITARGSVGKLIVCGKPMAMNQSCYALKPFDLEKYEYLFYLTKQLIEQLKKKGSGSVFKSINTLDIEQSFMSIAPNEIIELYCKKVKSIFERIKSNTVEIAKLTALRDKLLPLLMNGQVVVG